mgnify:CR=1 FL=1|jgi:uncharacterized membrane protein (UPF0127 family)
MRHVQIINTENPLKAPLVAAYCDSFISRFLGLMFTRSIPSDSGLLIAENKESILGASIHMMFMNYNIAAIWINSQMEVVDVQLAKRWHLSYVPKAPASFILETHLDRIYDFIIGDILQFESA